MGALSGYKIIELSGIGPGPGCFPPVSCSKPARTAPKAHEWLQLHSDKVWSQSVGRILRNKKDHIYRFGGLASLVT